uniref:Uncharacterized protein n=1 Tax=Arundo donax TaxID=35708 RepID=A0A0A8Z8U5_ARUDO
MIMCKHSNMVLAMFILIPWPKLET